MDAVETDQSGRGESYAETLSAFEQSLNGLRDSAQLARLTDDPAAPALEALVRLFAVSARQFHLRDRERKEIAMSMEIRARRIAEDGTAQIQASGTAIIERLAPELAQLVERSIRQKLWTIQARTILVSAGCAVGLALVLSALVYGVAYNAGRSRGLGDAHTITSAMAIGPAAASAWAQVMAHNDPVAALRDCHKSEQQNAQGRHFCALPIWLDAPDPPPGAGR